MTRHDTEAAGPPRQTSRVEHRIGADGQLRVRLGRGQVALRGVDGETVTVVDLDGKEGLAARQGPGWLEVRAADKGSATWGTSWGDLIAASFELRPGRWRHSANIEIEVPRRAQVDVEVSSADVRAEGLVGSQRYRTVSGEVQVSAAGEGPIDAGSVSGDLSIAGLARLTIKATSVSGQVGISAPELASIEIQTTSGDARLDGRLLPGGHRISSVSGDAIVVTDGGLTAEARTISGDIATDLPHRREGGRGSGRVVIGDGAARLTFKSMSGDLAVMAPAERRAEPLPAPVAGEPGAAAPEPAGPDPRLTILHALERGEIDVDEAGRRLAGLDRGEGRP